MITPPLNPCGNSYHQPLVFSVGREVEHDCLRKDAPVHRDDGARETVSLRHQAQIPQLVGAELSSEHQDLEIP